MNGPIFVLAEKMNFLNIQKRQFDRCFGLSHWSPTDAMVLCSTISEIYEIGNKKKQNKIKEQKVKLIIFHHDCYKEEDYRI